MRTGRDPSFELDDRTAARVDTLVSEGAFPHTSIRRGIPAPSPGSNHGHAAVRQPWNYSSSRPGLASQSGHFLLHFWHGAERASTLIPDDVRLWVCGASQMASRKPNTSLHPVAVGETLRRLCSKVAIELMGSSILEPVQVGVQTKFGCEAVVHTTRQWTNTFRDDPDRVLVLIDLANAFNCVSRGAVLSAMRKHFPWLTPWADTCYLFDSNLLVGSSQIPRQRGVQQGDPARTCPLRPCHSPQYRRSRSSRGASFSW